MSFQSILFPIAERNSMGSALQTALQLARQFNSYIEGFTVQPRMSEFITIEMGVVPLDAFKEESIEEAKKTKIMFESLMQEHGIPRSNQGTSGVSFGWLDDAPEGEDAVGSYGRVFDLTVLSRPDAASSDITHRAFESVLFESGRPVLLSPPSPLPRMASNILIAWNGSTEQARAIAFALPLLQRADQVTVLTIPDGSGVPGPTGEQLTRSLQRNGVAAVLQRVELAGRSTGETILATCASQGSDLLIKGAYTQSRLRQMFFGGATRHIVANATLPVFMAH